MMLLLTATFMYGQDLFFSEYIEGGSNNKALEVYNPTADSVALDAYQIAQAVNGGGWAYYHTFTEGAKLAPGDVWVIITDQVYPELYAAADADQVMAYPSVVHHNGDDARALIKINGTDTTIVDLIGDPDADPGSGWDVAGVTAATANHTLVRKGSVTAGSINWTTAAGTNADDSEWIVLDQDTFNALGIHRTGDKVAVQFSVNMTVYNQLGQFDAAAMVPDMMGSFNGWTTGLVLDDSDGDLVYKGVIDTLTAGASVNYKFRANSSWDELHDNEIPADRNVVVPAYSVVLPVTWLNDKEPADIEVTFQIDMSVAIKKNTLDKATLQVGTAGFHNGWTAGGTELLDADGDSIYVGSAAFSYASGATNLMWKGNYSTNGTDWAWESIDDRSYDLTADTLTLDVVYWSNDLGIGDVDINLTFSVDMSVKMLEGSFVPAEEYVAVRGSFNDWGETQMADADGDSIFTATVALTEAPGNTHYFKFFTNGPLGWEADDLIGGGNREYMLTEDADQNVPVYFFNNDEEVNILVDGNMLFQVDMTVLQSLGFYDRNRGDSLQIRGAFNGWGGNAELANMIRQPGTEIYEVVIPYTGEAGENLGYKFFINLAEGVLHAGEDFYEYELPAASGGGDRVHVFSEGNVEVPIQTFNDYVAAGVIADGESITVKLRMDMTDAIAYETDAFDPNSSRLYFRWQDAWGAELQGVAAGDIPIADSAKYEYTYSGVDNIWELDLTITGPAPHAIMYNCIYYNADGSDMPESGPGYGFGRFRTQWIRPDDSGNLVDQVMDVVKFSNAGVPHEVEAEPFEAGLTVTSVESVEIPSAFALKQNFPNPFNPTTTIEYSIPEMSDVTLVIYNSLGQTISRMNIPAQNAGTYNVVWNGINDLGQQVSTGVYFYQIQAGEFNAVKKMVFMK